MRYSVSWPPAFTVGDEFPGQLPDRWVRDRRRAGAAVGGGAEHRRPLRNRLGVVRDRPSVLATALFADVTTLPIAFFTLF
jgi:hypothetical protein